MNTPNTFRRHLLSTSVLSACALSLGLMNAPVMAQTNAKVLSNMIKQKRKEKAGKWSVPLPKVRGIAEDEMFKVPETYKLINVQILSGSKATPMAATAPTSTFLGGSTLALSAFASPPGAVAAGAALSADPAAPGAGSAAPAVPVASVRRRRAHQQIADDVPADASTRPQFGSWPATAAPCSVSWCPTGALPRWTTASAGTPSASSSERSPARSASG